MDRFAALETFVGVYEAGSFSAASRRLHVGQPAVSKSIAQLEKSLGVKLLLRSPRGLSPTEAGQRFYEHARRALQEADDAVQAARDSKVQLTGRLRVCAAVTFACIHVVPHLDDFLDEHPGLSIDVVLDDRKIDLLEEGIDVALRMGVLADSSMTARRLGQSRRLVFGTPAYFLRRGEPRTPAELSGHRVVVYTPPGGGATWNFRRGSAEISVALSDRLRVTAAEGVRAAVLSGASIGIGSEWMFAPEVKSGSVKAVLTEWSLPPLDLWAVYPAGRMASVKARAFADFVEALVAGIYDPKIPSRERKRIKRR